MTDDVTNEKEPPVALVEFEQANTGLRVGLIAGEVEGLVELDQGRCQIVTSSDTYCVKISYDDARERIWPDRTPA